MLWKDGISVKAHESTANAKFHAAALCVGCDIPATRKVCGFTGHGSNKGCSKCKKFFPGSVGTKIDFFRALNHALQGATMSTDCKSRRS